MRLAIRLFSVCFLLEIVGLYHYLGQDVQQYNYTASASVQNYVAQISPSDSVFIDLIEFLEGKDGDENSEEDTYHSSNLGYYGKINRLSDHLDNLVEENPTNRLLQFKIEKYPLFVLHHSWKFHTA